MLTFTANRERYICSSNLAADAGAASQGAIQQIDAVEVGGVGNAVDLVLELGDLLLDKIGLATC